MRQTVTLIDPAGHVRATLTAPASPEALLRAAKGLDEADRIVVIALDNDNWTLAIIRRGGMGSVEVLDVRCGTVPDPWIAQNRDSMIELAWLDLVEAGWRVHTDNP